MDVVFMVIYGVIIEAPRENSKDGRVGWQRDTPSCTEASWPRSLL